MKNSKTSFVTMAAIIAALYVVLTFVSSAFGMSSGVIQVRLSESLIFMAAYTPAAVPGLFVGCLLSNILTGCCLLDIVAGSLATLIGAALGYVLRKWKYLIPIPTIIANALIVPVVLIYGYGVDLPYIYQVATVGAGEIISAGGIGLVLYFALEKVKFRSRIESLRVQ